MRFSSKLMKLGATLAVVLLFVAAGIGSGRQIASLAQGSTPAATTQAFAPCPANSGSAGGANATMSATSSAGGSAGSGTGGMAATASAGSTAGAAYVGIEVTDVENCGVQVLQVMPGSPADMAKLQVGDVIVAVNGQAMSGMASGSSTGGSTGGSTGSASATMSATSSAGGSTGSTGPSAAGGLTAALASFVQQHQPGDVITLTIERAGQQMDVPVTLAANPSSNGGSSSGGSSSGASATMAATPSQ
jgi:hypothetical protein